MNQTVELAYAAKIVKDGNGFLVTFRDLENVFTEGATYEEAIFNAREVLDLMLLDRLEKQEQIPVPSAARKKEMLITPSPEISAPVLLCLLRTAEHRSMAEVARKMSVSYQGYQRLEAGRNLTLKSLKKAAAALGSIVEIRLRKVAVI